MIPHATQCSQKVFLINKTHLLVERKSKTTISNKSEIKKKMIPDALLKPEFSVRPFPGFSCHLECTIMAPVY